jgi:hypothetical protein
MVTKKLWLPHDWQQNVFDCHSCGDEELSVIARLATKSFLLSHEW